MSDDAISLAQEQEPLDSCSLAHVLNLVSVVRLLRWEERLAQERAEAGDWYKRQDTPEGLYFIG